MKKEYAVGFVAGAAEFDKAVKLFEGWAEIDCYPWGGDYRPVSRALLRRGSDRFYVCLRSFEDEIRAQCKNSNDSVCCDSCLEFFFNPSPAAGPGYFNFELNPRGVMLLGCERGEGLSFLDVAGDPLFNIAAMQDADNYRGPYWEVRFEIPYDFIKSLFPAFSPESGGAIEGNFYKCGDNTRVRHYACWSPIVYPHPSFHRPEQFGVLRFV